MDIFKLFTRNIPDSDRPEDECDDICQLLIKLTKLITDINNDEKYLKFSKNRDEEIELLQVNIENLTLIVPKAYEIIHHFDFRDLKFNGYRSFFQIIRKCLQKIELSLRKAIQFKFNYMQAEYQWSDYSKCLSQLTTVSKCLYQMMLSRKDSKSLFLKKADDEAVYLRMMNSYDTFLADPFYGHSLGFYLCESCRMMAKLFCSLQLGLGQAMSVRKSNLEVFVATVVNSTHSLFLESNRGSQMCNLFKQATVTFCKQFWNLVDHPIVVRSMHYVLPHLKVIKTVILQPIPISLPEVVNSDVIVEILPPSAEVNIRLLSSKFRTGMEWNKEMPLEKDIDPPSNCILIHCHGGGFVAQSSQSHDAYLRQWAIDFDCPIVSIDYSHAPEFPFPWAHQECFYTYCWVLRNLQQFGCDSNCRVVICGDSAGGNLALGCVVKAIQLNIRLPDGIFLAYPATLVDFVPSPARMLGVIDPILPLGVLARCLLAYVGANEESLLKSIHLLSPENAQEFEQDSESEVAVPKVKPSFLDHDAFDTEGSCLFYSKQRAVSPIILLEAAKISNNPIMSPLLASDAIFCKFPPLSIIGSEFDPLLDDSVELCKKIDHAGGRSVRLNVMRNLPHGFLSMVSPLTRECAEANKLCVEEIRILLSGNNE